MSQSHALLIEKINLKRRLAVPMAALRLVLTVLRVIDIRLDGSRLPAC